MADGKLINVTPENWNELALQERQLEEKSLGRKLTSAESISIIENYRRKGLNQAPIDDAKRIAQASGSVTYAGEARKLYGDDVVDVAEGAINVAKSLPALAGQTVSLAAIAGVAVGAVMLVSFVSKTRVTRRR